MGKKQDTLIIFSGHTERSFDRPAQFSLPLYFEKVFLRIFFQKKNYQNWHQDLKISVFTTLPKSFSWKFENFSCNVQTSFRLYLENTCNFFISSISFSSTKCFSGHTKNKFDNPNGEQSPGKNLATLSTDYAEVTSFRS